MRGVSKKKVLWLGIIVGVVAAGMAREGAAETGPGRDGFGQDLRDHWHRPIHIAVRKSPADSQKEFIVWSAGPDGVSGTADDIISGLEKKDALLVGVLANPKK